MLSKQTSQEGESQSQGEANVPPPPPKREPCLVYVCVHACMHVCVHTSVCACACMHACTCVCRGDVGTCSVLLYVMLVHLTAAGNFQNPFVWLLKINNPSTLPFILLLLLHCTDYCLFILMHG